MGPTAFGVMQAMAVNQMMAAAMVAQVMQPQAPAPKQAPAIQPVQAGLGTRFDAYA